MPNALLPDQYASGMSGSSGWNPSRAVNAGLFASGFAPSGVGQLLNAGYGAYNGFNHLSSQNNEGLLGYLDPTEPSMWQNAGNWMGSGIANLLGYGSGMSTAQGQMGDNQFMNSSRSGMPSSSPIPYQSQPTVGVNAPGSNFPAPSWGGMSNPPNYGGIQANPGQYSAGQGYALQGGMPSSGMALNPDGSPSDAQLQFAANGWGLSGPAVPSLNYNRSGGGGNAGMGGFSGVGYAPGADFMSGFGSQGGGYSGGGSYPGLRTLVR